MRKTEKKKERHDDDDKWRGGERGNTERSLDNITHLHTQPTQYGALDTYKCNVTHKRKFWE